MQRGQTHFIKQVTKVTCNFPGNKQMTQTDFLEFSLSVTTSAQLLEPSGTIWNHLYFFPRLKGPPWEHRDLFSSISFHNVYIHTIDTPQKLHFYPLQEQPHRGPAQTPDPPTEEVF